MNGFELSEAVAADLMGWKCLDGIMWSRHGWPTGFLKADSEDDRPECSFWRPDISYFHLGLVAYEFETQFQAAPVIEWKGGRKMRIVFNDPRDESALRVDAEWFAVTANYTKLYAIYAIWGELDAETD